VGESDTAQVFPQLSPNLVNWPRNSPEAIGALSAGNLGSKPGANRLYELRELIDAQIGLAQNSSQSSPRSICRWFGTTV